MINALKSIVKGFLFGLIAIGMLPYLVVQALTEL